MHDLWLEIFGNHRPVEVEVGSGTGTFVLPAAASHPDINYLAIEYSHSRARCLELDAQARDLTNVVVLNADAGCVVTNLLPDTCVSAYHVYFPDPWWKRRHHRRRLFTPAFAAALSRTLKSNCRLHVATDVPEVFATISSAVAQQKQFVRDPVLRSPRTQPTSFERKGLKHGAAILEAVYVRIAELDDERLDGLKSA